MAVGLVRVAGVTGEEGAAEDCAQGAWNDTLACGTNNNMFFCADTCADGRAVKMLLVDPTYLGDGGGGGGNGTYCTVAFPLYTGE